MAEASAFSWFENYTKQLNMLEGMEAKARFAVGIANFGTFGIEPDFSDDVMLSIAFEGIRVNIKNSRESYLNGKKGGRPRGSKKHANKPPFKTPLSNRMERNGADMKACAKMRHFSELAQDAVQEQDDSPPVSLDTIRATLKQIQSVG